MAQHIINFIETIESIYKNFCINLTYNKNLRQISISKILLPNKIDFEPNFNAFIKTYRDSIERNLSPLIIKEQIKLSILDPHTKLSNRIKIQESLMFKIRRNIDKEKILQGKLYVYKILNDLIGLRIIITKDYELKIKMILDYFSNNKDYKIIHKDKDGYKAYHIYTNSNNKIFPLEIQIWDLKDEDKNKQSHSQHKMGYKEFLTIYQNL